MSQVNYATRYTETIIRKYEGMPCIDYIYRLHYKKYHEVRKIELCKISEILQYLELRIIWLQIILHFYYRIERNEAPAKSVCRKFYRISYF